jgi:glycosyltransferase involved in cell wall biosynthesis
MGILYDDVNLKAKSGTELMLRGLEYRLQPFFSDNFAISRSIPQLEKVTDKIRIYWAHNEPGAEHPRGAEAKAFANRWESFDRIVFVSEWQKDKYIQRYKIADEDQYRLHVLRNAIVPIEPHTKPNISPIRLVYYSTPHRGLDLLYSVFERLSSKYNIILDVFSSYQIYGVPQQDVVYRMLFNKLQAHPKINYHTSISNEAMKEYLKKCHILAYPTTFNETSCICLIEAISAGLVCVHPDKAGLIETSGSMTRMYEQTNHRFNDAYNALEAAIIDITENGMPDTSEQKAYADEQFSWDNRILEWEEYLNGVYNEYNRPSSDNP